MMARDRAGVEQRSSLALRRQAEAVRDLFDFKAAAWSEKYDQGGPLVGRLAEFLAVLREAAPEHGPLLDLGCGTGELARSAADGGFRVTACDIAPEMLARAIASDAEGVVTWVQLEPEAHVLPFDDGSFEVVVASSVLEYLADPAAALRECRRVLSPGGLLLCTVPDLRHPVRWLEWVARVAVRAPLLRRVGTRCSRAGRYAAYLRLSRQRHRVTWWRAKAGPGLVPIRRAGSRVSPLRHLAFRRRIEPGAGP